MSKKIDLGGGHYVEIDDSSSEVLVYHDGHQVTSRALDGVIELLTNKLIELTEEIDGLELANIRLAAEIDALEEDL